MRKNKEFIEIYGFHSVKAALKNSNRKNNKLIITKKNKEKLNSKLLLKLNKIVELPIIKINKIYGNEDIHQGIVLKTSKLTQPSIDDIIDRANKEIEVIVMLDHVSDPNNIGSIMRSCALFNCKSIIVAKNHSPNITPAIIKSASGAIEIVNYIRVTNLCRTIKKLKKNNFWVIGLDTKNNKYKNKFIIPKKCLLILGSEGKGLRNLTKKECDDIQNIPMKINIDFEIDSLNVSNACSIALYNHYITHS